MKLKLKYFLYFIIYFVLFSESFQISENENINIENLPLTNNDSFKIIINYLNGKYYIPMSPKDAINIKIESKNEDLNNYYYKYYYIKGDKENIYIEDNKYYNKSNIIMVTPEAKYIIVEMKHKINNNKIYLKSDIINYNNFSQNNIFNNSTENNLKFFKPFSLIILFSTFFFAATISIVLICIDLKEDKKNINSYNLTAKEKANQEYQTLKNTFINRNTFLFALFLMKFTYPFFNIFTFYNYNHPRYIRLFIILIKIVLNLLISFLFYFIFSSKSGKEFMLILYSLIASLIICFINYLITIKILGYDKIRKNIWKPKFEYLRKYIFYTVKKDILFNTKWHLIRNRMISYTRICGNTILSQKPSDKYQIYADNKKRCNKALLINDNIFSNNDRDLEKQEDMEIEEFSKKYISYNSCNIQAKKKNNLIGNNRVRKNTFFSKNNEIGPNSSLSIDKGVQSFSISNLGQNNLKLNTVQKIENIKNRYILNVNDSKFDETLEVNYYVKTYDNLEIENLENYTYISTDSMNNQISNTTSESNKIFMNLIATFIVLLLLSLVDIGLIIVANILQEKEEEEEEEEKDINVFFMIVMIQIIVINFIINYFYSLNITFYIFNNYGKKKKNGFHKMVFKFFVEKYIKYIYRIRLLINKYTKELEFMER